MVHITLDEKTGMASVYLDGHGNKFSISKSDLREGAVFDSSDGSSETFRLWVSRGKIYLLHLFGHDVAWPSDVYEFPLEFSQSRCLMLKSYQLYEYLAKGFGIPAAPGK
jgi:hypothetical protein